VSQPTVAILGASRDRRKYGNKSVRAHLAAGYQVYPVNPHAAEIEGLRCYPSLTQIPAEKLDRISVYLPPEIGVTLLGAMGAAQPAEVWFNPGSSSPELRRLSQQIGLTVVEGCSIVALGLSPADFP
jgi:hypothetical protein